MSGLNLRAMRWGLCALIMLASSCGNPPPARTIETTRAFNGREATQTQLESGLSAAQRSQPVVLEPEEHSAAPEPSPEEASRQSALIEMARACVVQKKSGALIGVHGSPLLLDKATFTSPSEWRDRGEKGSFAERGEEYRSVYIPESPPFDERVPNGVAFELNTRTGTCAFPRWSR